MLITRSKGRQREYESMELGEVKRGGVAGERSKKRRGDRESEAVRECSTKSRGPRECFAF